MRQITTGATSKMCCLVMGPSGAGKTKLISTIPEGEKVCVISIEPGLLCVADLVENGTIKGVILDHFEEIHTVYKQLMTQDYQDRFKWVYIDSLSELSDLCEKSCAKSFPNPSDTFKMWGEFNKRLTEVVKLFRDMPHYNVVFTCLDVASVDQMGGVTYEPYIGGKKLKASLRSMFDEVLHLKTEGVGDSKKRIIATDMINGLLGKDRSGKLETFEEPNLSIISNKIFNREEV